jgi:hypothetical protein
MGAPLFASGIVGASDSFGAISVGTTTNFYHAIDLTLWDGSYHQATDTNPADPAPADANYMVFTGLNSASVTVVATSHPTLTGPGSISGFQLVANVASVTPVPIAIAWQGGNLVLTWTGSWVLQRSDTPSGVPNGWHDVNGASSPYTIPQPLTTGQYYRLRSQ